MMLLVSYAFEFVGTPYKWGGSGPEGIDCSGLVQEILMSVGMDPVGDQTAQALYEHYSMQATASAKFGAGALCFYGRTENNVSHVAFMIDGQRVIEAGGGGSKTLSRMDAERDQAFVRVRPFNHRKDLVCVIMPDYPEWVKK